MAEIPVEKVRDEEGASWWAWMLALLLLAGVVWLVVEGIGGDRASPGTPEAAPHAPGADPEAVSVPPRDASAAEALFVVLDVNPPSPAHRPGRTAEGGARKVVAGPLGVSAVRVYGTGST